MYLVGLVLKPQGVRGELKINSVSPDPNRFKKLKTVFIKIPDYQAYSIERVRLSNRFVYLKLAGIDDRNQAERLRGKELFIEKDDLILLPAGSYFIHDVVGCRVYTLEKQLIGTVHEVLQFDANDLYSVVDDDGKEFLIPAVKSVVKQIDIEKKIIKIDPPEGLIE